MKADKEQIITRFHEKGYKATPQRLAIYEYVLSSKEHPTTDIVYAEVKKMFPTLSLATVYQTLHLLTDIGLLQELEFSDRVSRYDPKTSPHINIICRNCGTVEDYEGEEVEVFWNKIIDDLGFEPLGQRLDIYRYCDHCRKTTKGSKPGIRSTDRTGHRGRCDEV